MPIPRDYVPRNASIVLALHAVILIGLVYGALAYYYPPGNTPIPPHLLPRISTIFGVLGATVSASRYVVLAVRQSQFEGRRIPWQIMTPLLGGVLALSGFALVHGGILVVGAVDYSSVRLLHFTMAFSFLVGLTSEFFTKRLIRAAEELFGERSDPLVGGETPPLSSGSETFARPYAALPYGHVTSCEMCGELASGQLALDDGGVIVRSLLLRSGDLALIPSRGALVVGHTLVVPTVHETNLLPSMDHESRTSSFHTLATALNSAGGIGKSILVAEHGTLREPVAAHRCATAHAHIHLIPLEPAVATAARDALVKESSKKQLTEFAHQAIGVEDYIFVGLLAEDGSLDGGFMDPSSIRPQVVRREVASALNLTEHDWRKNDRSEVVLATIKLFGR